MTALTVFIVYLCRNADRYRQLLDLSTGSLFLLVGLALVFSFGKGLTNRLFYSGLGVPLTLNEGLGLAAVTTLANHLPFSGGLIAKGAYLKQRHKLGYTRFLSATLALYVCSLAVNGVLGLAVMAYWKLASNTAVPSVLVLGFSAMAASFLLLILPWEAIDPVSGKLARRVTQLVDGWQVLSKNWVLFGKLIGIQIGMVLVFAGRFWLAFHALSQDVTLAQCVLFSLGNVLTTLVTITPGGLGVREGIVAGVASLLGFEAGVSAVAVGIDRLVATSVVIVLGTIYTYVLSKKATDGEPADAVSVGE